MAGLAVRGVLTHRDGVTQQSFSVAVSPGVAVAPATTKGQQRHSLTGVMGAVRQLSAEVSSALTGLMEAEKHTGSTHHDDGGDEEDDEEDSDEDEATAAPPQPKKSKTSSCN